MTGVSLNIHPILPLAAIEMPLRAALDFQSLVDTTAKLVAPDLLRTMAASQMKPVGTPAIGASCDGDAILEEPERNTPEDSADLQMVPTVPLWLAMPIQPEKPDTLRPDDAVTVSILALGPPQCVPSAHATPVREAAAPAEQTLDLARDDAWLDRLARDIVTASVGERTLKFRLLPERLGPLDVGLTVEADGLSITLTAHTREARDIVAAAQPRLVEELRNQGVRIFDSPSPSTNQDQTPRGRAPKHWAGFIETGQATHLTDQDAVPTGRFA
jgi:flagellar hook-length control protein FliK